ncbi:hypothetical protein F5Y10DRAFT_231262 [Nemania abortiva]|nr:hypothetical protein F5Y10DRAFT_231262 [Nemania abortiva]
MLSPSPPAGSHMAAATRAWVLLAAFVYLPVAVTAQTLPYIPTSILLPAPKPGQTENNATGDVAYIFSPQGTSVDLLSVNISATLEASSLPLSTLSSGLPFLKNSSTAFTPSLADNGSLLVYAGDCSTSKGSSIWSFNSSAPSTSSALWTQGDIESGTDAQGIKIGPGFLGASFSFSTILEPATSPAYTFVYGGMCPNNNSDSTSSQTKATYSNQMVKISPSDANSESFSIELVDSNGPPIPEAGFTFTGLSPSFANRTGTVTQQINYVLLGGHTQYAFVNMSTLAIWSLPEESWGFVSDIAMADSSESVDSRSGHTTVLNEDGTALVIYGGWVGDLTQAAYPQLAVLQIGSDYGGAGDWQWIIPDSQPSGDGIYGHGAALLPGNVMMVYGGHTIPSSGSKTRREASAATATFLNLTSMTWADSYTNPSYTEGSAEGSTSGTSSSQQRKLGLGVGLGLGLGFLVVLALLAYLFYRKRQRDRRTVPDAAIRALAQDNSRFLGHDEFAADDRGNDWYVGGPDPYARGGRSLGYQSLQTGRTSMDNGRQNWFGDLGPTAPPMLQINRKPIAPRAARGQHQPTSSTAYEQVSNPRGLGGMNPIFEADEDDTGDIGEEAISPVRDGRRDSGAYSDPFVTPTRERPLSFPAPGRSSQTPSPEERERKRASVTDPDVQDWMTNVDVADALMSGRSTTSRAAATAGAGRTSPSRRGFNINTEEDGARTESNISESNRSDLSRSGSLLRRLRPGFGVAVAAALAATTEGRGGSSSSSSAPSYNTARSSFAALQAEGPGLLSGREREREDNAEDDPQEPGSPSKNKPRRSWLGSLRRVFSNPSPDSNLSGEMDEDSPLQGGVAEASDFEARLGSLGGIGGIAADGLLRRKGGRGAWESSEAGPSQGAARYTPLQGATEEGVHPDDEEWDIEKAVEKRLVQVMFTVPREPLRVVNAEPDFESEQDVILVDPERDGDSSDEDRRNSGEQEWMPEEQRDLIAPTTEEIEILSRPIPTPSPLGDEDKQRGSGSNEDAEKEALRRELDAEWERIEAQDAIPEVSRTPPQAHRHIPTHSGSRAVEHDIPKRPPLLHRQHLPKPDPEPSSRTLTLEEQIDKLGAELHQARSAAQTPMSVISHHSDADVLSAEAVRFERTGSTSTLQITPIFTGSPEYRSGRKPPRSLQKSTDFRSESNLRGNELRNTGNTSPTRRVRAMVEEFESKSSREASPAASPVKGKGTPTRGTPTRGSPVRER